jgi:hypothetical protein
MRITAQQALNEVRQRRLIFNEESIKASKTEKQHKLDYIRERAREYMDELLAALNLPTVPTIEAGAIRGFENNEDFANGTGTVALHGAFMTTSGVRAHFAVKMPLYRGELLKPAVMQVNGRYRTFSNEVFAELLGLAETKFKSLTDMFLSTQSMETEETNNTSLFQVKDIKDARPFLDVYYIPDREDIRR